MLSKQKIKQLKDAGIVPDVQSHFDKSGNLTDSFRLDVNFTSFDKQKKSFILDEASIYKQELCGNTYAFQEGLSKMGAREIGFNFIDKNGFDSILTLTDPKGNRAALLFSVSSVVIINVSGSEAFQDYTLGFPLNANPLMEKVLSEIRRISGHYDENDTKQAVITPDGRRADAQRILALLTPAFSKRQESIPEVKQAPQKIIWRNIMDELPPTPPEPREKTCYIV